MRFEQVEADRVVTVIAIDVRVQRAGVDDQCDGPTSLARISSMRSEMSVLPLAPAPAAMSRRLPRGASSSVSIASRVSSDTVIPRRCASCRSRASRSSDSFTVVLCMYVSIPISEGNSSPAIVSRVVFISRVLILMEMLMAAALDAMEKAGLNAVAESGDGDRGHLDAVIEVSLDGQSRRFAVELKRRTPYPNEIGRMEAVRQQIMEVGEPLLVTHFVSNSLSDRLTDAGWSWVDLDGNMEIRAEGLVVSRRVTNSPSRKGRPALRLPGGAASATLIRLLIGWPVEADLPPATDLAQRIGVSQPRISQILGGLGDQGLVQKRGRSWFVADRGGLLDRYLDERIEVEHETTYLYTLSPLKLLVERAMSLDDGLCVSADIGPDLVAPWKEPAAVVLYASRALSASELGTVRADSPGAANVLLRSTREASVEPWPRLSAQRGPDDVEIPLVDPAIMMRDLLDLGGSDRIEAAGVLRDWIMERNS